MLPPMPGPGLPLPPPVVWNVDADLFEIVVAVPGRETQQQPASRSRDSIRSSNKGAALEPSIRI